MRLRIVVWLLQYRLANKRGVAGPLDAWPGDCDTVTPVPVIVSPPGIDADGFAAGLRRCYPGAASPRPRRRLTGGPPKSPREDKIGNPPLDDHATMKDLTEAERRTLYRMPHSVRATFLLWRIGINPKYTIAAETYRRHRALLADKYGIDITALP